MGSIASLGGRGSGVCEVWYMGGGVGETIGTWRESYMSLLHDNILYQISSCRPRVTVLTCVGSGWTGTVLGCVSRDSGWTEGNREFEPQWTRKVHIFTHKVSLSFVWTPTWRAAHLWQLHVGRGFHRLCWDDGGVDGLSVKLQHGVLGAETWWVSWLF